jgi:hypothetical protein
LSQGEGGRGKGKGEREKAKGKRRKGKGEREKADVVVGCPKGTQMNADEYSKVKALYTH